MKLTLPLTAEEEMKLRARAQSEGITPEEVVHRAIQPILESAAEAIPGAASKGSEKAQAFRRWAKSFPADLPVLSLEDVSRDSMYRRD